MEELEFYDIGSDYLFKIIKNINCQKIKKITATCDDLEDDYDWVTYFQKMPLLEEISIEEHQTMFWTYNISPIFLAERKRLPFPLLEQLIRNYLNGSPDRDIFLTFDDEFDLFWDYFKDKKDILFRVSRLDGEATSELIDTYFKAVINQHNTVDRLKEGKYLYLIVESPYNNEIFEFIKKNKIKYLFIKGGGNVNLDELIKCNDLKFIFDNSSKTFLFKKNNNLERI